MTLKKLFILGSALAAGAYLSDKNRRDRALRGAKDFLDNAKHRLQESGIASEIGKNDRTATSAGNDMRSQAPSDFGSTYGSTRRPPGGGIY